MTTQLLALLIDADNASPKINSRLLAEVADYGTASVKRVYGDWAKSNLNGGKTVCLSTPCNLFSSSHTPQAKEPRMEP